MMITKLLQSMTRCMLSVVVLLISTSVNAQNSTPDFKVNGIWYSFNADFKTVSADFSGTLYAVGQPSYDHDLGDVVIPETVEYNGETYTVTGINPYAFYFCTLSSITLPSTLRTIGRMAFNGYPLQKIELPSGLTRIDYAAFAASQLQEITIPEGIISLPMNIFNGCSSLTKVVLPFGLKTIDEGAFSKCTSLKEIFIPSEVTEIGVGAFYNSGLESIALPPNLKIINKNTFQGVPMTHIQLPDGVEIIDDNAFRNSGLVSIYLSANLDSIGQYAFYDCENLDNIQLDKTHLRVIGDKAFLSCTSLSSVYELPSTLETVGEFAFGNDSEILQISIPSSVTHIKKEAFRGCQKLILNLPAADIVVEEGAFYNIREVHISDYNSWMKIATANRVFFYDYQSIWPHVYDAKGNIVSDYVVPEGITSIGYRHFYNNTDITSLKTPQSLKTIERAAFVGCSNLKSIELSNVEVISDGAFVSCGSLETVKLSPTIKEIQGNAFGSCSKITYVDIADLANWCGVKFTWGNGGVVSMVGIQSDGTVLANPLRYSHKIVVNGKQLDELKIPSGVTSISDFAFSGCLYFDKVTIPNTVDSIGAYAFANCTHIDRIVFANNSKLKYIGKHAFEGSSVASVTLPNTLVTLGGALTNSTSSNGGVFKNCSQLRSINLPSGITEVADETFLNCSALEGITIPNGVKRIGASAFENCNNEKFISLSIPSSVEHVANLAFTGCTNLKGIYITDLAAYCKIQFDGEAHRNPLYYARKLYLNNELITDLIIPEGVTEIKRNNFPYSELNSVTIPEGVTSIGAYAFEYSTVNKISLPASLTSIGVWAFAGTLSNPDNELHIKDIASWATNIEPNRFGAGYAPSMNVYINGEIIKDLVIPEGVTNIIGGFSGWNIETVTLPKSLEIISNSSFINCRHLKTIYSKAKFAPQLQNGLFSGHQNPTQYDPSNVLTAIYVPAGKSSTYKNSWTSHADIIKEADQEVGGVQSVSSISELRSACAAINGAATYFDLTNATLDETVTAEALGAGEDNVLYYLPSGTDVTGDNIVVDGVASNVKLTDGQTINVPSEFTANNVTYSRTLSAGEFSTLCLPYDSPLPTGIRAYSMKAENSSGKLVFKEVASVKANEPYLVEATADVSFISATDVTMQVTPEEMTDGGISGFEFRGTLMPLSHDEAVEIGAYMLDSNKKWIPVADADPSASVVACRAYLVPSEDKAKESISCVFRHLDDVEVPSDVNMDGEVDSNDVVAVVNIIAGMTGDDSVEDADINGDGKTDIADIIALINLLLEK